jgi:primary-amine oxidase
MTAEMDIVPEVKLNSFKSMGVSPAPHPLVQLSRSESDKARKLIISARGQDVLIQFRTIFLEEPAKQDLVPFLDAEYAGNLTAETPRPARLAKIQYDVVKSDKSSQYIESTVDLSTGEEVVHRVVQKPHHANITL